MDLVRLSGGLLVKTRQKTLNKKSNNKTKKVKKVIMEIK
jgi:hypothetical protein